MITDEDITKLKKVFITKNELKQTEDKLRKEINLVVNSSTEKLLSAFSVVVESFGKEIRDTQLNSSEQLEIVNDHERRIEKLEKVVLATPAL